MKLRWPFALIAVAAAGCGSATTPATTTAHHGPATVHHGHAKPVPGHPVPASAIHRLTALANRAVKAADGHGVDWATVVVTTRKMALTSATPADVMPHVQRTVVYLVTIKGRFVARGASVPPGGRIPRGTYLSIVVSANTFAGLDSGLSKKAPPVSPSSFGPVTHLHVSR